MNWLKKIWNRYKLQRSIAVSRTTYCYDKEFVDNCLRCERKSRETVRNKYNA